MYIQEVNDTDYTPTFAQCDIHHGSGMNRTSKEFNIKVDSSSQIAYRCTASAITDFDISSIGFIDNAEL